VATLNGNESLGLDALNCAHPKKKSQFLELRIYSDQISATSTADRRIKEKKWLLNLELRLIKISALCFNNQFYYPFDIHRTYTYRRIFFMFFNYLILKQISMKAKTYLIMTLLVISSYAFSTTIVVDKNGGGNYTSITQAISSMSGISGNDTIKVWPGVYSEQITLNKNITIIGSGYENTLITSSSNPTIAMSSGKILHFKITCLNGDGIWLHNGIVSNCVITGCSLVGILAGTAGDNGLVQNCIISNNISHGVEARYIASTTLRITVTNCIATSNGGTDFYVYCCPTTNFGMTLSYSLCGTRSTYTSGNVGVITNTNPLFVSTTDFHISQGSPCWDSGNPAIYDPDGTSSDMGYFGGPDCPIYPVVTEITISPNGNNVNMTAKGRANY
jgi:hypothetical protein